MDTKIICIEGLDGSGKTTLINKLDTVLYDKKLNVNIMTPFMVTDYGSQLKSDILNSKNHFRELTGMSYLLYSLQSKIEEHLNNIKNKYDVIILDRYIPSFYTYQIYNNKQDVKLAKTLLDYLHENSPDIHHSYLVHANITNTNIRLSKNIIDNGDIRALCNYHELQAGYIDYYRKYSLETKSLPNNNLEDLNKAVDTIVHDILDKYRS